MARMIPNHLDNNNRSDAERDVFEWLRDAPDTEEWVVLHSLNLTKRDKKPYGEVDFVLLVPYGGVYALEVKGGGVSVQAGVWHSVNRKGERAQLKRSPLKQAQEGMWELRTYLLKAVNDPEMGLVPFGSGALLPDTNFTATSLEWAEFEIIDRSVRTTGIGPAIKRLIKGHHERLTIRNVRAPSAELVGRIRSTLRPDFECVMHAGTTLALGEKQLQRMTEEQFGALDVMEFNDRLLCEGAAGTGKTMLALELARREARKGLRTLLVCFNKLLGSWLAKEVAGESEFLAAGSFHQLGHDMIKRSSLSNRFEESPKNTHFWQKEFGELAWQAIIELGEQIDVLIVDEGQDLAAQSSLDVFEVWLRGGMRNGRWAFFADFERQAIFVVGDGLRDEINQRAINVPRWGLKLNCRNTKRVARETALLSGFPKPPYRLGQFDGLPVDTTFCKDDDEAASKLSERISAFLNAGGSADDLVVLSPRRLENSCADRIRRGHGFIVMDASEKAPERSRTPIVRFATVQAFKGMESQAVILCDVNSLSDGEPQSLLYVGMSRARLQLMLVLDASTKPAYDECRAKQFSPEWK